VNGSKVLTWKKHRRLKVIQHVLVGIIAAVLVYSSVGSTVVINGVNGKYSYSLHDYDNGNDYDSSYLFNNILGNNLSNVIKLVAIRSQLETSGAYDADKEVDVTAYNNRGSFLPGDYITASYKVSDLIKWAQSGFNYEQKYFSTEETHSFLSNTTTYTHLMVNSLNGGMNSYLNSQISNNKITSQVTTNVESDGASTKTIMINDYLTVDGKKIEELVSNWSEYDELCNNVVDAANELLSSYEEYQTLLSYYSYQNSNIRYYITRNIDGSTEVFTNVDELSNGTVGYDIPGMFKEYGKYVIYTPSTLDYTTNTMLSEDVFRGIKYNYGYAFPDNSKFFIAVDTSYPIEDDFTEGKAGFSQYMPYSKYLYFIAVVCFLIYAAIMIYVIRFEGHIVQKKGSGGFEVIVNSADKDEQNKKVFYMQGLDKIYLEAFIIGCFGFMISPDIIYRILYHRLWTDILESSYYPLVFGILFFIWDMGFVNLIYGIVRRFKAKILFKNIYIGEFRKNFKNYSVYFNVDRRVFVRTLIIYMICIIINIVFVKYGGMLGTVLVIVLDTFVGVYIYRTKLSVREIIHVLEDIEGGNTDSKVDTSKLTGDNVILAEAVNSLGEGIEKAVNTSIKDEKLKTDLITNVSHDIKTPLTSIINYVNLIKHEPIDNPKIKEYIDIIDSKSQRLKQLTDDLLETSKIQSGTMRVDLERLDYVEFISQIIGEYCEEFDKTGLKPLFKCDVDSAIIMADNRLLWRVMESLMDNVTKYAMPNTRVYMELIVTEEESGRRRAVFSIKNISATELNFDADEITERFMRGDLSRNSEGNGLGLAIAKGLTLSQGGRFDIILDGDLFKAVIDFEIVE